MKRLIPDEDTATRIGTATGKRFQVFTYTQPRSGLTLFAVELVEPNGKTIEIISTQ